MPWGIVERKLDLYWFSENRNFAFEGIATV
jgi:hypothetical protein